MEGMEKGDESSPPKRARVSWKDCDVAKTFLESSLREISINGREGGSLKAISWKNIAETLQKTHNLIVEQRQMKNHYDYLKGKYGAWSKLKNKKGYVYDPSTNSFKLSEEEWQMESKANKYVVKLRNSPLPFPDLCVQLFDGVTSTGSASWGPTYFVPNPTPISSFIAPKIQVTQEQKSLESSPLVQEGSSPSQTQKRKRKSEEPKSSVNEDDLSKVVTSVENVLGKRVVESDVGLDVGACVEKLEKLGWESPLYEVALHLFTLGVDYKKLWLCLKHDRCEGWVKFTGRQLGLI